jgi:metallo-beta-lactamase class B
MNDSLTMQLVTWMNDSLNVHIVGFVPNHWHADCMGGLGVLQHHNVESYAHQMTIDIAKSKHLPLPAHGFRDSLQLRVGEKQITCFYFGAAHTLDNIVVWIPSEQILFAGCMVKSIDARDLGNIADADTIAYPETIQRVINKFSTAKIIIPGHGAWGGLELLKHTQDLLAKKNEELK